MPNGGSDCCGTCWFSSKNKGQAGFNRDRDVDSEADFCTIRNLPIDVAFYTYCGNHPHRRPERDPIPVGPVFTANGGSRGLWRPSPDTPQVRQHLLDLLDEMRPYPPSKTTVGAFPHTKPVDGGGQPDEVVVWQLGEFREPRAIEGLRRVASFDESMRQGLVTQAREALAKINGA